MNSPSCLLKVPAFVLPAIWSVGAATLWVAFVATLAMPPAYGSVAGVFEISDGNAVDQNSPEPEDDWNTIVPGTVFTAPNVYTGPPYPSNAPFSAEALTSTFVDGGRGGDRFTQGSKDDEGISAGPGSTVWHWDNHNPPPGNDFINSYAGAYLNALGQQILVCGVDRYQTNGSFAIGCWFFQDQVAKTGTDGGDFVGNHSDGDVLVTAEFGGSGVSAVNVFRWNCPGLSGAACDTGGTVSQVSPGTQTDFQCSNNTLSSINFCGETNLSPIDIPWEPGSTYKTSNGELVPAGTFVEVIVNTSALFGGGQTCFSSFMATSRSSAEFNAELKEFELGEFNLCRVSATKVCAADPAPYCSNDSETTCTVATEETDCGTGNRCYTGFCEDSPTTGCTMENQDSDCGTGKHCITTNPYIAADGVTYVMDNVVHITNPSPAPVYDCEIKENTAFATGESCKIIAVDGTAVTPVDLSTLNQNNELYYHAIPNGGSGGYMGSISALGAADVLVECKTFRNPYPNQVNVRCASTDGGTLNISANNINLDTSGDACAASPVGGIDVSKVCIDTRLKPVGTVPGLPPGDLVVETVYQITVENTGNEKLDNIIVTDQGTDASTPTTLVSSGDNVSLAPGAKLMFTVVDTPASPDQSAFGVCSESTALCTLDTECPNYANGETCVARYDQQSATFADTATASGIGHLSTSTASDSQTLSPPCRVCQPPPCPAEQCMTPP